VVEGLPGLCKVWGSIPSIARKLKKKKERKIFHEIFPTIISPIFLAKMIKK
jgi:hypothetical protein